MGDEWGPWIEHDGKKCPVPSGTYVRLIVGIAEDGTSPAGTGEWAAGWRAINDFEAEGVVTDSDGWIWGHPDCFPVIRYRIRKPRGLTILEAIVADPEPLPAREVEAAE